MSVRRGVKKITTDPTLKEVKIVVIGKASSQKSV